MKKIFTFLTMVLLSGNSHAGPRVIGGGGDVFALQFVAIGGEIAAHFQDNSVSGIDPRKLAEIVESTRVESTDRQLYLNGVPKDAINYPSEKRIIFNRHRWAMIRAEERPALVLHEYLGILGIEEASYRYSKELLKGFQLSRPVLPGSDSFWGLCADDGLVVNFYEHRAGVDTRDTDVTMIFGGHTLMGRLGDTTSGPIALVSPLNPESSFIGIMAIDFQNDRISLDGVLNLAGGAMSIKRTLNCTQKIGRAH